MDTLQTEIESIDHEELKRVFKTKLELEDMSHESLSLLVKSLDSAVRDSLYRFAWEIYVKDDFIDILKQMDIEITEDQLNTCVERYVYHGDYDCTLPYWSNLENIIKEITKE